MSMLGKRPRGDEPYVRRKKAKAPRKTRTSGARNQNALGRITGRVAPSKTTLARSLGPFQGKKFVTLLYENALTLMNGTTFGTYNIGCNDAYDVDKTTVYGNKQPLYYDTLLTGGGPYKQYKVHSWKTTYTILNDSTIPINVWVMPPNSGTAELDLVSELDNFPGVVRKYLSQRNGANNATEVTVTGHVADVFPGYKDDVTFIGSYNSSPQTIVYGGLGIQSGDGSTTYEVYVAIKHEMYVELQLVDALVS